jgi:phosphoribosylamine--glycine ligase
MVTAEGPKVLEFNCRFGDPETQPQLLRLKTDLVEIIQAAIGDDLLRLEIEWSDNPSACVVLASGGYPVKYEKGKLIMGLDAVAAMPDVVVFHAGTRLESGNYYTNGGRVLGVCGSESTLTGTMTKIYAAIERIHFEAMHFRRDIGAFREVKS